jgi:hypothetical protein
LFVEETIYAYEKSNHTWFGAFRFRLDAGVLCQRASGDYYHNTPDYGHNTGAAADVANNDNNHPHGWWLLIGGNWQLEVTGAGLCGRGPVGRSLLI